MTMKYIAIIDADEQPARCEFICNGSAAPYLLAATTDIKALEQEPTQSTGLAQLDEYIKRKENNTLDKLMAEIKALPTYDPKFVDVYTAYGMKQDVLEIIDKYKEKNEGKNNR